MLSAASVSFTYLNIVIANSATIHTMMETHEFEQSVIELCPNNEFGSEKFGPSGSIEPNIYFNLIVVNDSSGVTKKN